MTANNYTTDNPSTMATFGAMVEQIAELQAKIERYKNMLNNAKAEALMDEPAPPDCDYADPAHKQAWIHWAQVQMPTWARMRATENEIDARRYRWLRLQDWSNGPLCVLRGPKAVIACGVNLGDDYPSCDRLDEAIDSEISKSQPQSRPSEPIRSTCGCTPWEQQQRIHCRSEVTQHPECLHSKLSGEPL